MFNESTVVSVVVKSLIDVFPNVVCVDDGSSDNSARLVQDLGATVIRHSVNLGQGAALQTGFDYLYQIHKPKYVLTFDADGQHSPADALKMLKLLVDEDLDIVFATRFGSGKAIGIPLSKVVLLKAVVSAQKLFTRSGLTDSNNGLRVISGRILNQIKITHNGMAHATEIERAAVHENWRYAEVPVTIRYSEYSISKGQSLLNGIGIIFDLVRK